MMEWELHRRICRRFLTPSSRHGLRLAQESDYSSQSNLSRGMGGGLALRVILNRTGTARPSASFCHFIQPTSERSWRFAFLLMESPEVHPVCPFDRSRSRRRSADPPYGE